MLNPGSTTPFPITISEMRFKLRFQRYMTWLYPEKVHFWFILGYFWHNYALILRKLTNYASPRHHLVQLAAQYHKKVVCAISKHTGLRFPRKSGTDKKVRTDGRTDEEKYNIDQLCSPLKTGNSLCSIQNTLLYPVKYHLRVH